MVLMYSTRLSLQNLTEAYHGWTKAVLPKTGGAQTGRYGGLALLLLIPFLSVCGGAVGSSQSKQETARAELERRGIKFTPDVFVQRANEPRDTDIVRIFLDAGMDPNARG